MTKRQIEAVQTTFQAIEPRAESAMMRFYDRLFGIDPGLRGMFRTPREEQAKKLAQVLAVVVKSLDRLDQILPAVRDLGARHVGYGVHPEHYTAVGAALLWTLEQGLGERFTDEVKESWTVAYTTLAGVMQQAAAGAC